MNEVEKLERAIATINAQRSLLGDEIVETMLAPILERLTAINPYHPSKDRRKQVTVMFADMSGFTAMSESIDAELIHDHMNNVWSFLDSIIVSHGGIIDKHIGDAVMALWGADAAHENDPEQCIRAALTIQQKLRDQEEIVRQNPDHFHLPQAAFQMRIGISTGLVVIGEVGSTHEFTAMGDTVNTASRLQELAPVGGILITNDTYRAVRGVFDFKQQLPIRLRGKNEPILTYQVFRVKPRTFRTYTRGVEGVETRMIGREVELNAIQTAYAHSRDLAKMTIVKVMGEAGVGKSRLMYEFQDWLDLLPEKIIVFHGRGSESTRSIPFSLLRDIFAFRFQISDSDTLSIARKKLEQGFGEWFAADSEGVLKSHFLGHLIGLDFSGSENIKGILDDPRQIRYRAFHYLYQFFQNAANTVVLFLDDLQWADSESIEAIAHIQQFSKTQPGNQLKLLVVALSRPTPDGTSTSWFPDEQIDLKPLDERQSRLLVEEILQNILEIPQSLREQIVSGGEGNPFFLEELVKMLIDQMVIIPEPTNWRVDLTRLASIRIPPTLTGVLQARLDGLTPSEQEVLQRASIIGRVFWDNSIAGLFDINSSSHHEIIPHLNSLNNHELIFMHEKSTFEMSREYSFRHGLLREVTYETILRRKKHVYHERAAQWYIQVSGDRFAEYAGVIAEHFEKAEILDKAAEWYAIAGKQAAETYAQQSALNYYRSALHLAKNCKISPTTMMVWHEGLAKMYNSQANFADSFISYNNMLDIALTTQDKNAEARAYNGCAKAEEIQGNFKESDHFASLAKSAALIALKTALNPEDILSAQIELAEALYSKAWIQYRQGNASKATSISQEMIRVFPDEERTPAAQNVRATGLKILGAAYGMLGEFSRAKECDETALSMYRQSGDREMAAIMLNNLGANEYFQGNYQAAEARYEDALRTAKEIGLKTLQILLASNLGGARVGLREYELAEKDLAAAINSAGKAAWLPETYCFLSEAYLGQNKITAAVGAARHAIQLSVENNQPEYIGLAWRKLANCTSYLSLDSDISLYTSLIIDSPQIDGKEEINRIAPEMFYLRSLNIFKEKMMEAEQARTLRDWAIHEISVSNPAKADQLLKEAQLLFKKLGIETEVINLESLKKRL